MFLIQKNGQFIYIAIPNEKLKENQVDVESNNLRVVSWGEIYPADYIDVFDKQTLPSKCYKPGEAK